MAPAALRNNRKRSYLSDAESSASDYLSESEISEVAEDEYQVQHEPKSKKKQRVNTSRANTVPPTNEVELFKALSDDGIAVTDLAFNWVEAMEDESHNGTTKALTELFNLVLRSCGCNHLAESHDLASYDSAPATVAEVGLMFKRQKSHEYPFTSKSKTTKFFRRNVTEFFESVVEIAHVKGLLFKDNTSTGDTSLSSPFMNAFLSWLFALSDSEYRPFRYVATCLLYAVQEKLCTLAASSTLSVEKQQRQLSNAQNNTNARNTQARERKIQLITENIRVSKMQRDAVLEYLGDVFQNVFNSRYRDVDSSIRIESLRALAQWAVAYGDMFMQANYLRYFGWMLSDPVDLVKKESLKALHKLYKSINTKGEVVPVGLRQLTESFRDQLINMVWIDLPLIKSTLFSVFVELTKLGFLDDDKYIRQIFLYGFYVVESLAITPSPSAISVEYCNYIHVVCDIQARAHLEKYELFLSSHESLFFGEEEDQLDLSSCFKYRALVDLFQSAYSQYTRLERPKITVKSQNLSFENIMKRLFNTMYSQAPFQGQWESFLRYILLDFSRVQFSEKSGINSRGDSESEEAELKSKLELSTKKLKQVALCIFSGMLLCVLTSPAAKKTGTEKNVDELDVALPILTCLIPRIEQFSNSSIELYTAFLNIWNSLLVSLPTSITKLFSIHSSVEVYNAIHNKIMTYFVEMETNDKDVSQAFETYFAVMAKSFDGRTALDLDAQADKLLNTTIKIRFEDSLTSLVTEACEALLIEVADLQESGLEHDDVVSERQKLLLTMLSKALTASLKLSEIAKSININRFVSEPILSSPNSLLEIMQVKLLSKINMTDIIRTIPSCYAFQSTELRRLWIAIVRLILTTFCWSLEDLTYASGDNTASSIDTSVYLADYADIIPSLCSILVSIQDATRELNESLTDGDENKRILMESLVALCAEFGAEIGDILVALRTFYSRFHEANIFKNFDLFFESHNELNALVEETLPEQVQKTLLNVFLIKEAYLANLRSLSLEKAHDEDVNIEDFMFEPQSVTNAISEEDSLNHEEDESAEDNDDLIDADPESLAVKQTLRTKEKDSAAEETLCVFTLKLLLLSKTGGFSVQTSDRLKLNESILGELYQEVLKLGSTGDYQDATEE